MRNARSLRIPGSNKHAIIDNIISVFSVYAVVKLSIQSVSMKTVPRSRSRFPHPAVLLPSSGRRNMRNARRLRIPGSNQHTIIDNITSVSSVYSVVKLSVQSVNP